MLNAEKYKDEIEKILDYDFTVTKESREIVECGSVECDDCLFYENENEDCNNNRIKWLISEAKEKNFRQ